MSYQVLARKWRPKSFEELVGQKQTAKALINALESQRLHHAYLFTGTRGVGKTTIARILSKSLNCENGITSKPCGQCSSCTEIDQGNFVDLMEIDAASKTKVEDTRELLDNVQYRPTRGRYKVYLIDEVHMLSGHSFNALLKTLEEPPPHVIFLLATTDPQKLPVTVLSRCLQFHLKRMEQVEIVDHLAMILTAENIDFTKEALFPIAKGADGSMRDALSLLDQAIAFSGEKLELASVLEMLGSIDQSYCFQILEAIQQDNATTLMDIIQQMSQYSPDYFEVMSDWLNLLHSIAVAQATGKSEDDQITDLAQNISSADLQLYYQLSLQAKKDLPYAPHPRQGFEMALLRVLAFRPNNTPTQSAKKKLINVSSTIHPDVQRTSDINPVPVASEQKVHVEHSLQSSGSEQEQSEVSENRIRLVANNEANSDPSTEQSVNREPVFQNSNQALKTEVNTAEPLVEYAQEAPLLTSVETANNQRLVEADRTTNTSLAAVESKKQFEDQSIAEPSINNGQLYPDAEKVELSQVNYDNWHYVIDQMPIGGNGVQVLLNSLALFQDGALRISHLSKVSHFLTDNLQQSLPSEITEYFREDANGKFIIEFFVDDSLAETPKQKQIKLHQEAIDSAYQRLIADPCVAQLQRELGASLDKQSIILG